MKNPTKLNQKLRLILPILLFITLISGFFCINIFSAMAAENSEENGNMPQAIAGGGEHDQGHNYTANINNNLRPLVSLPFFLTSDFATVEAASNGVSLDYLNSSFYQSKSKPLKTILRI